MISRKAMGAAHQQGVGSNSHLDANDKDAAEDDVVSPMPSEHRPSQLPSVPDNNQSQPKPQGGMKLSVDLTPSGHEPERRFTGPLNNVSSSPRQLPAKPQKKFSMEKEPEREHTPTPPRVNSDGLIMPDGLEVPVDRESRRPTLDI